jgi:hypothetical protein
LRRVRATDYRIGITTRNQEPGTRKPGTTRKIRIKIARKIRIKLGQETSSNEPGTTTEPTNQEPGTGNQRTRNQEPTNQEPGTGNHDGNQRTRNQEPTNQEPGTGNHDGNQRTRTGYQNPR